MHADLDRSRRGAAGLFPGRPDPTRFGGENWSVSIPSATCLVVVVGAARTEMVWAVPT
jgi:hypothetical protein